VLPVLTVLILLSFSCIRWGPSPCMARRATAEHLVDSLTQAAKA